MQVVLVGSGQLARELSEGLQLAPGLELVDWESRARAESASLVVHAGSGRQLPQVMAFCDRTQSTLLELATSSELSKRQVGFPVVLCPNTNLLMLKFMSMVAASAHLFRGHRVTIQESHQASKTSLPGTAVAIARSLGKETREVTSVRDPEEQIREFGVPPVSLNRHAVHRIRIEGDGCQLNLESRVLGHAPYVDGVGRILEALRCRELGRRVYRVEEFVSLGWL